MSMPETLDEAIAMIPPTWEVWFRRKQNNGGCYFSIDRAQNGGTLSIQSHTLPTWQEAFADIWEKI